MRLLRARVAAFGPLRDVEVEFGPELNVVYGPNEAGKTTLLDFLLAQLFRWERRTGTRLATVLGDLDRFGDVSEARGSLELRLEDRVHEYPGGPSLLHRLGLEHAGLAGLFCVRSGELELPEKEEGEFWRELKKVLAGLPHGVDTLRERVHREARLTPTGEPSDRGDPGPKTRHGRLEQRLEKLERLRERLPEAGERELRVVRLERRQERLERARRARIARLHGELREVEERLSDLPEVPPEKLEAWRRSAAERQRLSEEQDELDRKLERAGDALREREEARAQARRTADERRQRRKAGEEAELEERARRLVEARGASGPRGPLLDAVYWAGLLVLVVAIGFAFFTPSDVLTRIVPYVLAALAAGGLALYWARGRREERAELAERERSLLEDATGCGLDVDDVAELPRSARRLEAAVADAERELEGASARAEAARDRVDELEARREQKQEKEKEHAARIETLRRELGFEGLEEAESARERQDELEDRRRELRAALRSLAGPDESDWEVEPPDAEEDLPKWSGEAKARVDRELEEARRDYQDLRDEFVAAGLGAPEDVLTELADCRRELRDLELDWEAGRLAGRVFASMDASLEDRLSGALARDGPGSVGSLVQRVTGRYVEVRRGDGGALSVVDDEGRAYRLGELSRGTRDQVYLALRLGLAQAALDASDLEEGGFFLLDDAFLTADWERRERLVDAVAELTNDGWQVVYLTCDDHLRDLFVEAGADLHEL